QDFEEQAAFSTPQRRDIRATYSPGPEVLHPAPAPQLPAEAFAADPARPSPNPQQRAASPPDRTSDREDFAALAFSPDPQMTRRTAALPHSSSRRSNSDPARAPGRAHVAAASGRWPASQRPFAPHPNSARYIGERIRMQAAEHSSPAGECLAHRT